MHRGKNLQFLNMKMLYMQFSEYVDHFIVSHNTGSNVCISDDFSYLNCDIHSELGNFMSDNKA